MALPFALLPQQVKPADQSPASEAVAAALLPLLLDLAADLSTATSIQNADQRGQGHNQSAALRHFLPEPLPSVRLGLLMNGFAVPRFIADLENFSAHLNYARRITLSALDSKGSELARGAATSSHAIELWRSLAVSAQLHIIQLASLAMGNGANFTERVSLTLEMLQQVAAGGTPCIDSAGEIKIGHAGSRRRAPRFPADMPAELLVGNKRQSCRIRDVSSGGFGISGVSHLAAGEAVQICFGSARTLNGTVAWVKGDSAGISLSSLLSYQDPLISWALDWQAGA